MKNYFKTVFSYIIGNKKEMLPHVFISFFILPLSAIPQSIFKTIIASLFPIFGLVIAYRAYVRTWKDKLEWRYKSFIIFTLPVLIAALFFFIGPLIFLLVREFFVQNF